MPHQTVAPTLTIPSRGFTLLELLVVISIMAIAAAGASLSLRDSGQAQLEREAERLAALLESARAQARANGVPVRWRPMPQGFRFEGLPASAQLPSQWLQPGVQAQPATPLILGPEPLIPPQSVTLTLRDSNSPPLRVATDGLRPFAVQSLP
ncbi:type II secretion system protein H [Delftia acidovorans CCUG 274B]|uniref:GspH/FimT family pseudopilin n=1 Tax=Delftia acidovorans TaxID=80866 RepID=UPI000352B985|nr:GspH/FimT family pseudopilin [Delftia acidovorans]EPD37595.1 type II secretion system protein H [Delftia acidovorans CCUG 274B]